MDVKCPSCKTEYELDEVRMRPGGVTVKCATCEHVFRVRRRGDTAVGMVNPKRARSSTAPKADTPSVDEERSWLIRLPDGEIKVCRELATLQRWIVSGIVSEECEISRTGRKWKHLFELSELSTFFAIAEEARSIPVRRANTVSSKHVIARDTLSASDSSPSPSPVKSPAEVKETEQEVATRVVSLEELKTAYDKASDATVEMSQEEAALAIAQVNAEPDTKDEVTPAAGDGYVQTVHESANEKKKGASVRMMPMEEVVPSLVRKKEVSVPPPAPGSQVRKNPLSNAPPSKRESLEPKSSTLPPAIPKQAQPKNKDWGKELKAKGGSSGRSGPTGGMSKGTPTAEAAFARSEIKPSRTNSKEFKDGQFVASDHTNSDDYFEHTSNRTGRWIVGLSLVILAGAGLAMYMVLFRDTVKETPATAVVVIVDASTGEANPSLGQVSDSNTSAPIVSHEGEGRHAQSLAIFQRYERHEIETYLESLDSEDEMGETQVWIARAHNALAQFDLDRAKQNPKLQAKSNRDSRKGARLGLTVINKVMAAHNETKSDDSKSVELEAMALAVKANSLRLTGSPTREVQRWLRRAEEKVTDFEEAKYVRAMLDVRDRRRRDARVLLEQLSQSSSSLRYPYHLAQILWEEGNAELAKSTLAKAVAMAPEHGNLRGLSEWMENNENVESTSTENAEKESKSDTGGMIENSAQRAAPTSGVVGVESYDKNLARADKAAESGNCQQAISLYNKALDAKPSGVAALTGLGYCHLDTKKFSSAQARFRAALGISPRYQDALWGVAEGYQQQGLKAQAIKAYRKFISEHPVSRRAEMAKRQIERLGGGAAAVAPENGEPVVEKLVEEPAPKPAAKSEPMPAPEKSESNKEATETPQ